MKSVLSLGTKKDKVSFHNKYFSLRQTPMYLIFQNFAGTDNYVYSEPALSEYGGNYEQLFNNESDKIFNILNQQRNNMSSFLSDTVS